MKFSACLVSIVLFPNLLWATTSVAGLVEFVQVVDYCQLHPSGKCAYTPYFVFTPVSGAKVYLQKALTDSGNYMTIDSAISNSQGDNTTDNFRFYLEPTATENGITYRILAPEQTINGKTFSAYTGAAFPLNVDDASRRNIVLSGLTVGVLSRSSIQHPLIHFSTIGDQMAIELGVSTSARTISIFNLSGSLQRQVNVPAGKSRVIIPATFAPKNGYLFQVK